MKRIFSILMISSLLVFAGCSGTSDSPESSWSAITKAADAKNCNEFRKYVTNRFQLTENDCAKAFKSFEDNGIPVIDWEKTEYNEDRTTAKAYIQYGDEIGKFIKQDDGIWQIDAKFWR